MMTESVCIAFTGRDTFVCTFEQDEHCLLTSSYTSNREIWTIDDGRRIVEDNTLRSGLYIYVVGSPDQRSLLVYRRSRIQLW